MTQFIVKSIRNFVIRNFVTNFVFRNFVPVLYMTISRKLQLHHKSVFHCLPCRWRLPVTASASCWSICRGVISPQFCVYRAGGGCQSQPRPPVGVAANPGGFYHSSVFIMQVEAASHSLGLLLVYPQTLEDFSPQFCSYHAGGGCQSQPRGPAGVSANPGGFHHSSVFTVQVEAASHSLGLLL
jgi:hypothetical protein